MDEPADAVSDTADLGSLIDEIAAQRRAVARAEASLAGLLVAFVDARRRSDLDAQAPAVAARRRVRMTAGEFAADELSLATRLSVYEVQCLVARTRRIRSRLPSVWDAWSAGPAEVANFLRTRRRSAFGAADVGRVARLKFATSAGVTG